MENNNRNWNPGVLAITIEFLSECELFSTNYQLEKPIMSLTVLFLTETVLKSSPVSDSGFSDARRPPMKVRGGFTTPDRTNPR
eukprot:2179932-Heterocapsa_arctica.AAC.1